MTNLDSILKSRNITLPTKVHLVKAKLFPVVLYGCESWTIKRAKRRRTDAFELWCWRRLLRVPWTARRSNRSILKEISPKYSLEGLMLKLKLQHFGHLMQRPNSFEKTLVLKDWGQEDKGMTEDEMVGWHHWLNGHEFEQALGVGDGQGGLVCCGPQGHKESDTTEGLEWTELTLYWLSTSVPHLSLSGELTQVLATGRLHRAARNEAAGFSQSKRVSKKISKTEATIHVSRREVPLPLSHFIPQGAHRCHTQVKENNQGHEY